jgi:ABC-2 type transport system ATP-binding protein
MIIDRGRIVAEGTPQSLRESWVGNPVLRLSLKGAPAEAGEALAALEGVLAVRPAGAADGDGAASGWVVEHARGADPREALFHTAVRNGWVLLELTRERTTLEDIFVRLTNRDAAVGDTASPEEIPAAETAVEPTPTSDNAQPPVEEQP